MGCEKIKNNAPPGFNGWPISRISPTEIRITAQPSTDGDIIDTFYHTLYCNVWLILSAAYNREITVFSLKHD